MDDDGWLGEVGECGWHLQAFGTCRLPGDHTCSHLFDGEKVAQ